MDEVHNTVTLSDGEGDSRKGIVSDAFTVFQKAMPPIARAHMESTIPQALLDEFRFCRNDICLLYSWVFFEGEKQKMLPKTLLKLILESKTVDFENDVNTSFESQQEQLAGQVDQATEKEVKQASV